MTRAIAGLHDLWRILFIAGLVFIVLDSTLLGLMPEGVLFRLGEFALLAGCAVLMTVAPRAGDLTAANQDAVSTQSPVRGEWLALNSPGQALPSHGTRGLGQLSAVDLIHAPGRSAASAPGSPAPRSEPPMIKWALLPDSPERYSCFGAPIYAVADGVVVRASDRQRDHRARNTWPALAWFFTGENVIRAVAGWRRVIGNHVVVRHGDGLYSAYAHIKRGSAQVRVGDRVSAGDHLAAVGNTGNSTQPHLHFQLMDRPRFTGAAGVPVRWHGLELGEIADDFASISQPAAATAIHGMPRNGQVFSASPPG